MADKFGNIPLIDSVLVSQASIHRSDEAHAQDQAGNESRFETQVVDDQSQILGSNGCEFVESEPLQEPAPEKEKISRKSSVVSDYSANEKEAPQEEEEKEEHGRPMLGCYAFELEVTGDGLQVTAENRENFDQYTHNLKNDVLQQELMGSLFDSMEDLRDEIVRLMRTSPNPFIEFDDVGFVLTLFQNIQFGKRKIRKPLLEIKLQSQSEFLNPLELCKTSSSRLFAENPTEVQKLFLKVTDQLVLQLGEYERKAQEIKESISRIEA